jgi:4-aminobutyrate aminotransferase-like enzyme
VINSPGPGMLRFLPPLIVGRDEVDEALEVLGQALAA